MARKIKKEYPEVDYKVQFGLCLSYLLKNKEGDNKMKEIVFEKAGIKFMFKDLTWDDEVRDFIFRWKAIGSDDSEFNNCTEDGYFGYAKVDLSNKRIVCSFKTKGKQLKGVLIPENIFKEVEKLCKEAKSNFARKFNEIVEEVVAGKKNINFSIVGCDFPQYQAWIDDTEGLKNTPKIMEEAIKRLTGESHICNACDYIYYKIKQRISNKNGLNDKAFNLKYDKEIQQYHEFSSDIVTSFDMKLADAIKLNEYLAKEKLKEEKRKDIFLKAKETGEKQILKAWSEPCNDPNESCDVDNIVLYAMPNGEEQIERYHTW